MSDADFPAGSVWLVGAGPGDPELLTRKAERLLGLAEIIFHDALVGHGILELASRRAELMSVGKRSGRHSMDQPTINRQLVAAAAAGQRVVRLKGGDPSIFGRSAEEVHALNEAGIPVRICAGVTAASAAAASASLSLTLRDEVRSLTILTAHASEAKPLDLDWQALARKQSGLAIYMGRNAAPDLARQLIAAGLSAETPVLIAVNVSLPSERLIHGKLGSMAFLVKSISSDDPTLLLIGAMAGRTAPAAGGSSSRQCCPSARALPGWAGQPHNKALINNDKMW